MKVIITGATGMVGKGVLLECLDHPNIEQVITIGRSETGIFHPKLKEIIHKNFLDYNTVKDQLTGLNAVYFCMGISAVGLKEEKYREITYDFTLILAETLLELNPGMVCTYVSGQGTDSTEKGSIMWARVKGKTENDLFNLGFKDAYMFRPGIIIPERGIRSKTKYYQFFYDYFMWFIKIIKKVSPDLIVTTTQIGEAMINVTERGYDKKIIDPKDILILSSEEDKRNQS